MASRGGDDEVTYRDSFDIACDHLLGPGHSLVTGKQHVIGPEDDDDKGKVRSQDEELGLRVAIDPNMWPA